MDLVGQTAAALGRAAEITGCDLLSETLVVGVSGGPDSLVLLHALRRLLRPEQLIVAHLDHGLRPTSAEDARFVIAAAGGLRCRVERIDVAALARARQLSVEEAGRITRYAFLAGVARAEGAAAVVVGHHADDQVETILMHFLRGSGIGGLRGMRLAAPLPGHADLWLLRPLLGCSRAEIEAYCAENGLTPVTDTSNDDRTFFRNRLRHELLPILEGYNPQLRERLRETADVLAAEETFLAAATAQAWADVIERATPERIVLRRSGWLALPLALRRRLLRAAVSAVRPDLRDVGYRTIEAARQVAETGATGARADLPGGVRLSIGYDHLIIAAGSTEATVDFPQTPADAPMPLPVPGSLDLGNGWRITAEVVDLIDLKTIQANPDRWTAYVALGEPAALFVHPRAPSERIRPLGLGHETKLKDVMINRKMPASARARWPIVATSEHIVWVVGHVLDERARVQPDSPRVVRLRCLRVTDAEAV